MSPREFHLKIVAIDELIAERQEALENSQFDTLYRVGFVQGELRALRLARETLLTNPPDED